jgi:subtilisin family serine protease
MISLLSFHSICRIKTDIVVITCLFALLLASVCSAQETTSEPARFFIKFKPHSHSLLALQAMARSVGDSVSALQAEFPRVNLATLKATTLFHTLSSANATASTPVLTSLAERQVTIRAVKICANEEEEKACAGGINRLFIVESQNILNVQPMVESLQRFDEVEYVEPERFFTQNDLRSPADNDFIGLSSKTNSRAGLLAQTANDQFFGMQWSLLNTGQISRGYYPAGKTGADINAPRAWDITTGSNRIIVAIIDTGVPLINGQTMVDFSGRLLQGYNFAQPTATVADDDGHGSNVASILCATGNNSRFVAGVDWKCMILPLKVSSRTGRIANSAVISALRYAADNGARVANLSLGSSNASAAERDAFRYAASKGLISVVAMGNDNTSVPEYPAGYSTEPTTQVIAVGATDNNDNRAVPFSVGTLASGGSNYGAHISFVVPGNALLGIDNNGSSLSYFSGTSQSTPVVAGVVSLLLSVRPTMSFQEVMTALKAGARDMIGLASEDVKGWDQYYGWGRVDAYRSLLSVMSATSVQSPMQSREEESIAGAIGLNVFPNPVQHLLSVECSTPANTPYTLTIINVLGEKMFEYEAAGGVQNMTQTIHRIDVRGWPQGIYVARMTASAFGVQTSPILIVQ